MSFDDFGGAKQSRSKTSSAIMEPSRISVSDASPILVDQREEKLFVSEINFNDGVGEPTTFNVGPADVGQTRPPRAIGYSPWKLVDRVATHRIDQT
jgi:hypothetical protein